MRYLSFCRQPGCLLVTAICFCSAHIRWIVLNRFDFFWHLLSNNLRKLKENTINFLYNDKVVPTQSIYICKNKWVYKMTRLDSNFESMKWIGWTPWSADNLTRCMFYPNKNSIKKARPSNFQKQILYKRTRPSNRTQKISIKWVGMHRGCTSPHSTKWMGLHRGEPPPCSTICSYEMTRLIESRWAIW